jgi:1-acyl-sn-glycerol-3-phosphate acyltransferase
MDSVILLGCLPRTGTLIKARSARGMTFAVLERCFDLVSVDQASHASIGTSLDRCRGLLRSGKNLLIFPEGRRARSSRLQHFNRIAFDLAQASGAQIVPAVIHSNCPFLSPLPGSIFPRERVVFRIRFLAPDEFRPEDTPQSVSDRIHRRIAEELKRLDAGTVWEQKPPVK